MAICRLAEANAQPKPARSKYFAHVNMSNRVFAVSVTEHASILALLSTFRMHSRRACRPTAEPAVAAVLRPPVILRSEKPTTTMLIEKISHPPR